jgi:hypothetical protein
MVSGSLRRIVGVELDAEQIRAAIMAEISGRLEASPPDAVDDAIAKHNRFHRAESGVPFDVCEPLIDAYGSDVVLKELSKLREDPFIANAIVDICEICGHRIRDFYSGEEIVCAALAHLIASSDEWWSSGLATGQWAFSALWGHDYEGTSCAFDDDEHFALVIKLLDRAPMDDDILFLMGDGPLSHAAAIPSRYERIQELAKTHPQVARAWFMNLTDGQREFNSIKATVLAGWKDAVAVAVEIAPDVDYGVVLTALPSGHLRDDLLRHVAHCEWEPVSGSSGGGIYWTLIESEQRGILRFSGEAPPDAKAAIIEYAGLTCTVPVKNGHFLFVDWNTPNETDPRLIRFA